MSAALTGRLTRTIVACALAACLPTAPNVPNTPGSGILFIGNSLTYWNDLPRLVQGLFDAAGGARYEVTAVAAPDVSLEDHWNEGSARRQIERGGWQIVVLQQGPSSVEQNRLLLRDYVARFATRITSVGARPALYSVWPSASRQADFERAIESYQLAAADVGGLYFPVADAWRAAWRRDPELALYSPDGLHPSVAGSYLAALVMYGVIADTSPVGLPAELLLRTGITLSIPGATAAVLQAAAADVVGKE